MSDLKTMVQTQVSVDGHVSLLAQGQDADEVMRQIEDAVASGGRFVHLVVAGNRRDSVLVTPSSRASVSVSTVLYDERDDGDLAAPFGGLYDLI
ncbi:hypothetical protein [uncultured Microbacterium sp.]|uniref:hypothetical protein n=1 Tax=uncultured Microbacterium sp. TaxID=191216 RepID=UPI0028D12CA6|nr:hypothetical protein [uncultured Microbacterium sp.]